MNAEQTRQTTNSAFVAFLQLSLVGLTVLTLAACSRAPYSSPTALRDTNAYVKAISPAPSGAVDSTALDQITTAMEGETVVATLPASPASENSSDGLEHVVKRLAPGEKLEGDGATFGMVAFSVSGPGISRAPAAGEKNVALDFFAPDGRPLAREELKALGFRDWQLTEYVGGGYSYIDDAFPEVKVWFDSSKQPPGYFSPVGVFDARTKHALVGGNSYSQISGDNFGYAEIRPRAWHATPMELVVDVELDGKSVVETNAIPGMTVPVVGGLVQLLGVWDGDSSSWSSGSGSGRQTTRITLTLSQKENQTNAVALFVTEPPRLAVHCELLDEQGRKLVGDGGGASGGMRLVGLRGRATEVKQVRFTVFTNHHRVILTLPPIPNLPAAGLPAANLFDVAIPRLEILREYELRDVIEDMTQMRFAYPPGGNMVPTNLFPLTLTNVTPAGLMAIYRSHLTNNCTIVVDEARQEIRIEPTQFEKIRRWVKQKLRL